MNENVLFLAFNGVDDEILKRSEADTSGSKKKNGWLKWGSMAACFGLIFTLTMITLPNILRGQGNILPPSDPNVPGPVVTDDDSQSGVDSLQPPAENEKDIIINWDGVAVNESQGPSPDAAPRYYDPELYASEHWGEAEVVAYYGWNLAPDYIPEGLTGDGNGVSAGIWREKSSGEIVQEQAGRSFWSDYYEDGSPKSDDELYIPTGFTVRASRLGILRCGLIPVNGARTTDFGGVAVTISHCSMEHGPYNPTQKAPDGLSNMPTGYYDIYTASFALNGVQIEIEAQRLELEEIIKIVASVINMPYSEDFTVGA